MIRVLQKCLLHLAVSIGLLVTAPAFAKAPAPPAAVVQAVTATLREAGLSARTIAKARGLYRPVMLTASTAPDWLVDMNAAPSGMLCGTGGCPIEVWVLQGERYRRALSLQVLNYSIEPRDVTSPAMNALSLTLHGALCGKTGSDECRYRFGWTPAKQAAKNGLGWFLPTVPNGGAPGYLGPLVQALAEAPRQIPALAAQEAAYAAWCERSGGIADTAEAAALLPDLNGDAVPEALFDANRAICTTEMADASTPDGADAEEQEQQVPCADPAICHSVIYRSAATGWQAQLAQKPFAYWIKWQADRPRLATADADCGMCEIREIHFPTN